MPTQNITAISYGNACIRSVEQDPVQWIWEGVIAQEAITLLSAPEKTGKTTLLSLLLDRRRQGGRLLGRSVRPGRTILCSEENSILWARRQPPLDFGPQTEFHRPLHGPPTRRRWRLFIDHLLELGQDYFNLLVIDTAVSFLPAAQSNCAALRKALYDLRVVAHVPDPPGILLLHQMCSVRNRSRARGTLAACADILIDMQIPAGDRFTRRRLFQGVGRYPGTLQHVAAELNPEGTDYLLLPEAPPPAALGPILDALRRLLGQSLAPLTRRQILTHWPESVPRPRADSLGRSLVRGCELGIFTRTGAGTRTDAYRYALA